MEKRLIIAELKKVFTLLKACFDKKLLLKIAFVSGSWNKAIKKTVKNHDIEVPSNFNPEKKAYEVTKRLGIDASAVNEAIHWSFIYLFMPDILDLKRKVTPIYESFNKIKEKNPEKDHNFTGYLYNAIKLTIFKHLRDIKKQDINQYVSKINIKLLIKELKKRNLDEDFLNSLEENKEKKYIEMLMKNPDTTVKIVRDELELDKKSFDVLHEDAVESIMNFCKEKGIDIVSIIFKTHPKDEPEHLYQEVSTREPGEPGEETKDLVERYEEADKAIKAIAERDLIKSLSKYLKDEKNKIDENVKKFIQKSVEEYPEKVSLKDMGTFLDVAPQTVRQRTKPKAFKTLLNFARDYALKGNDPDLYELLSKRKKWIVGDNVLKKVIKEVKEKKLDAVLKEYLSKSDIDKKEKKIIEVILKKPTSSVKGLAKELKVSEHTIETLMERGAKKVEKFLKEQAKKPKKETPPPVPKDEDTPPPIPKASTDKLASIVEYLETLCKRL